MRKLIPYMTALMAVSLVLLVAGCSRTGNRTSWSQMSDSDMEKQIQDRFKADPQLSAFDIKVSADSKDNEIKLSGTVNSEDARKKAVQIAQSALPGFSVSDTIDVKPKELARSDVENGTNNQSDVNKDGQRDYNQNQSGHDSNYNRDLNRHPTPSPAR